MALKIINYTLLSNNRKNIRREIAKLFLSEEPGTGKGEDCARYHYVVESYGDYDIILKRPTGLNKGFDFTVNVSNMYFKKIKRYQNPSHGDIISALIYVKNNYPTEYLEISSKIMNIFNCKKFDLENLEQVFFPDGDGVMRPIAILLFAIKWLFIEQDITYWNWSGRNMLMEKLKEDNLV